MITAIIWTAGIAGAWVGVQFLWGKVFREEYAEEDVLAGRRSCANCGCSGVCDRKVSQAENDTWASGSSEN